MRRRSAWAPLLWIACVAVDPRNGDVWAAYGAAPGNPSKVARLRREERSR